MQKIKETFQLKKSSILETFPILNRSNPVYRVGELLNGPNYPTHWYLTVLDSRPSVSWRWLSGCLSTPLTSPSRVHLLPNYNGLLFLFSATRVFSLPVGDIVHFRTLPQLFHEVHLLWYGLSSFRWILPRKLLAMVSYCYIFSVWTSSTSQFHKRNTWYPKHLSTRY